MLPWQSAHPTNARSGLGGAQPRGEYQQSSGEGGSWDSELKWSCWDTGMSEGLRTGWLWQLWSAGALKVLTLEENPLSRD